VRPKSPGVPGNDQHVSVGLETSGDKASSAV
jgi:hypothetical protein